MVQNNQIALLWACKPFKTAGYEGANPPKLTIEFLAFCEKRINAKKRIVMPRTFFELPGINRYADYFYQTSASMNYVFVSGK
jgi:hypothetical protein